MITAQDDLLGHQTPTSFAHASSTDPAWMERLWYTGQHVPEGDLIFSIGLGYHPNRGVMDGYVGVALGTTQFNFRVSRRLKKDPLSMDLGPLHIRVVEGFHRHRLTLEENASGISFDLEFVAKFNCHEEEHHFRRRLLRVVEDLARYQQAGRYEGWIKVGGVRRELGLEQCWGQRDHSWGVRSDFVTDEACGAVTQFPPFLFLWFIGQFDASALHLFVNERAPGNSIYLTGEEVSIIDTPVATGKRVVKVDHEIVWADDSLGQTIRSASLAFVFADGTTRHVEIKALRARVFLKAGLYGGLNGWRQGDDKGDLYIEHERWDLTDPATRAITRALADCAVQIRSGDQVGYGVFQYGVTRHYPKYEAAQVHPAP